MVKLDAALAYAKQGRAVFLCHSIRGSRCTCSDPDCESPGKHPRTKSGLKDATMDSAQIQKWWKRWPDANIAIVTGEVSGVYVIDVDGEEGVQSLKELEESSGLLPPTLAVRTPRPGLHLYLRHPNVPVSQAVGIAPHIDVRGDGGYVIAPPSSHVSGNTYLWAGGEALPDTITGIAKAPNGWTSSSPRPSLRRGHHRGPHARVRARPSTGSGHATPSSRMFGQQSKGSAARS